LIQSNNIKKAAIYCRVASNLDEPNAIRKQEKKVLAFAKSNGNLPSAIYSDNGYSGLSVERPALQRMIADIETGKITHVYVDDISHLFRDIKLSSRFYDLCDRHDVAISSVKTEHTHDKFNAILQRLQKAGVAI